MHLDCGVWGHAKWLSNEPHLMPSVLAFGTSDAVLLRRCIHSLSGMPYKKCWFTNISARTSADIVMSMEQTYCTQELMNTVALMKAEPGWIGTSTNEARRLRSATHRPKQAYAVQPPLMLQVLGAQAAWTRMQYAYLHVQHARVPLESRWSRQWISACTL